MTQAAPESEVWAPVCGYEDYFEVSNRGRVRSLPRHYVDAIGRKQFVRGKLLALNTNSAGYPLANLCVKMVYRAVPVHTLVLTTFKGARPRGMECCHNDGNRKNNLLSNLRWDTRAGNMADKIAHGTHMEGVRCPKAKLCNEKVKEIRRRIAGGEQQKSLALEFGVSRSVICEVNKGRAWSHVGGNT